MPGNAGAREVAPAEAEERLTGLVRAVAEAAPSSVVWKNADAALRGIGDVDLLAPPESFAAIEAVFRRWATFASGPVLACRHVPAAVFLVAIDGDRRYELDVKARATRRGIAVVTHAQAHACSISDDRGFLRLRPGAEGLLKLAVIAPKREDAAQKIAHEDVAALLHADPAGVEMAGRAFGPGSRPLLRVARAVAGGGWDDGAARALRRSLIARAIRSPADPAATAWFRATRARECPGLKSVLARGLDDKEMRTVAMRHAGRGAAAGRGRGRVLVIAGPDGTGKTSLAERLLQGVLADVPTMRVHHRDGLGVLPRRMQPEGPSTQPHRNPPYPTLVSLAKVGYLWLDFFLGTFANVRPFVRRGGWVLMERAWWDIVVDQRRYRLQKGRWLARLLGRALPRYDLVLVLEGPPDVIRARKAELTSEEIERQVEAWRTVMPSSQARTYLDAASPLEAVVARASSAIRALGGRSGWVNLPSRGNPRFVLPRAPRRTAARALRVYHPVTVRGALGWHAARLAARLGAFRLLPRGEAPPPEISDGVRALEPHGDIAIARANHPGRSVAQVSVDGDDLAVCKVATDEAGREAVAREAQAIVRARATLPAPLDAPAVRASAAGTLSLEPVRWRARWRAWRLPPEVAEALGRWFRAGAGDGDAGPSHGDCAPWNLLRTSSGWTLIDWEAAREDAPPFADVFHYLIQAHALLGRPSRAALVRALDGRGAAGRAIAAYARGAGLDPSGARASFVRALREGLAGMDEASADGARGTRARRALLRALGERDD